VNLKPSADAGPNPGTHDALTEAVYRVGAVARLTNIPVETLRVWERRHGIVGHTVEHHRHRLYSVRDVRRLSLIKKLVDLGSSISSIARLPQDALQQMYIVATDGAAARADPPALPTETRKLRLMLVGPALQARFAAAVIGPHSVDVVAQSESLEAAAAAPVQADVLAVEVGTLQPQLLIDLGRVLLALHARFAIIAYRFAATEVLHQFVLRGHVMQQAPLPIDSLDGLCAVLPPKREVAKRRAVAAAEAPPTPAARFDERSLARVANLSTDMRCECPRHLAELLLSVSAFETYSAQCASRGPEDAELHRYLGRVAAQCRLQLEQALLYIAQVEGIPLERAESGQMEPSNSHEYSQ
jgi:DNA-binding transcriptional MerR regulator